MGAAGPSMSEIGSPPEYDCREQNSNWDDSNSDGSQNVLDAWCTVGLPQKAEFSGQVFYELTLHRTGPSPQIGWATAGFAPSNFGGVRRYRGADDVVARPDADGCVPTTTLKVLEVMAEDSY